MAHFVGSGRHFPAQTPSAVPDISYIPTGVMVSDGSKAVAGLACLGCIVFQCVVLACGRAAIVNRKELYVSRVSAHTHIPHKGFLGGVPRAGGPLQGEFSRGCVACGSKIWRC